MRRVVAFVDLVQDIEVMSPLLLGGLADRRLGWDLRTCVSRSLRATAPDAVARLQAAGAAFRFVRRSEVIAGGAPSLRGVHAVLTASESSHPAHAAGHALARRAKAAGIATYTLQHGLENVGLIGPEATGYDFASDAVLCWFPEAMAGEVAPAARGKLVHLGRPQGARVATAARFDVGVFENLHAERYSAADRSAFVAGLTALAHTGRPILLRPHPAGRWSQDLDLSGLPNVEVVASGSAAEAVASVRRVITTPSTLVLDAVQAGLPVALAGDGGDIYRPFPRLASPADWIAFAQAPDDQAAMRADYLARVLRPGDAAGAILDFFDRDIKATLASKRQVW